MAHWANLSLLTLVSCVLISVTAAGFALTPLSAKARSWEWVTIFEWFVSVLLVASVAFDTHKPFTADFYFAGLAGVLALLLGLACPGMPESNCKTQWKLLVTVWAILAGSIWVTAGYLQNRSLLFHGGLLFCAGLVVLCLFWFKPPWLITQALFSLLLLLLGLPVVDFFIRPQHELHQVSPSSHPYSLSVGKHDPEAFARWWRYYLEQWDRMAGSLFIPDPAHALPFKLRPGGVGFLCESRITINTQGFRGAEFFPSNPKPFRIVAIGESTTFGCTLEQNDRPWPELLQALIQEHLHPRRTVEVINAGVPAYDLGHSVYRLPREILPLKPDLIISYHGVNGFRFLHDALPALTGARPPAFEPRPLKLLADAEYRAKLLYFRNHNFSRTVRNTLKFQDPMDSEYARLYRELLHMCRTNQIKLAVANFSMAVNSKSPLDAIQFYRAGSPSVFWQIRANELHSQLVEKIAQSPNVYFIDTHPQLDGANEKFIDLVHLTQPGRQQLAENIFTALRPVLEESVKENPPSTPAGE